MKAFRIFIFILISAGLIWLTVILIGKALSAPTATNTTTTQSLVRYDDPDTQFVMFIDGPVQADQTHQSLRISVSQRENVIELMNGYEGQVVNRQAFESNSTAFATFLKSLDKVNFSRTVSRSVSSDERGYCPLQNRFIYTIEQNGAEKQRAWTSSCRIGNYTGNQSMTRRLFIDQIPSDAFNSVLQGVNLSTQ